MYVSNAKIWSINPWTKEKEKKWIGYTKNLVQKTTLF